MTADAFCLACGRSLAYFGPERGWLHTLPDGIGADHAADPDRSVPAATG